MLRRRGAQVVHGPVMHTSLLSDAGATLDATAAAVAAPVDHLVLTTGIGTRSWLGVAESAGLDGPLRVAASGAHVVARGPKARSAAIGGGIEVDWHAPGETSAELLAHLRDRGVAGRRVVVQRDGGEPLLADALRDLGADVVDVPVYRWRRPDDDRPAVRLLEAATAGRVHALTFTCAYGVGSAFALAPDPDGLRDALSGEVAAVAVGPVTASALRGRGVEGVVEPVRPRLGAMVQALIAALVARHRELRYEGRRSRWQGHLLVHDDGTEVGLTPGEARVLAELVRRAPAVVPKAALIATGTSAHAAEATVARLRAKLGSLGEGIRAVPRRGYSCGLEVAAAEGDAA